MPGCWILSLHLLFQLNNNLVKNKIMKKVMLLVLVSTLSLLLSSCYSSQLYVGGMEVDEPKRVLNSKTNNHFLFGLISPASNKKDIKQYNSRIHNQRRYQAIFWGSSEVCNQKPPYFFKWFFGGYYLWYLYSVKNYILCTYK